MGTVAALADLLFGTDVPEFGARWRVWSARRARSTSIVELVTGSRTKVIGIARPLEGELRAPFTKRPALAWRARLEAKRREWDERTGTPTVTWTPEIMETSALPFVVEDEGGRVMVEPRHAVLAFREEEVNEHPRTNDDNAELGAYLRRHGILPTLYMGISGDHRFHEGVVAAGDHVAVWGTVTESSTVIASGYRDAGMRTKTIRGSISDPLVLLRL